MEPFRPELASSTPPPPRCVRRWARDSAKLALPLCMWGTRRLILQGVGPAEGAACGGEQNEAPVYCPPLAWWSFSDTGGVRVAEGGSPVSSPWAVKCLERRPASLQWPGFPSVLARPVSLAHSAPAHSPLPSHAYPCLRAFALAALPA